MLHIVPAHPGGALWDVPQDDDGSPVLDVLRPDAVSDLIGRVPGHTEDPAALDGDPGSRGAHSDRLEGELRGESEVRGSERCEDLPYNRRRDKSY